MKYEDCIHEIHVSQGSLIFLHHNEKPVKSGWWRKVKNGDEVIYVLEKPMHKGFNLELEEVRESRIECGTCVMKANTLNYGQKKGQYDILISAEGLAQDFIVKNNYLKNITKGDWNKLLKENITISDDGEELFSLYIKINESSDKIKKFLYNII